MRKITTVTHRRLSAVASGETKQEPHRKEFMTNTMIYTSKTTRRVTFLAVSALSLAACTSSLVLGTAYNAAAKRTADRVKTYADFDSAQQQWIDQSFQSFQQWHRISELPAYSALLNDVADRLKTDQPVAKAQLDKWFDTVQQYGLRARKCSPLSGSSEFLSGMASWQIRQLDQKLKANRLEQLEKYKEETVDDRRKRRRELIITWASRAGVSMSDEQQKLLDETLSRQTSMGDRRFQLWDDWTTRFIALLETRESEKFPDQLRSHIDSIWNMTERNYPAEWKQNRELWQNFAHVLTNDLSIDQRESLVEKITSISESVATLSKKGSRATPVCHDE